MTFELKPLDFSGIFEKTFKLTFAYIRPYIKPFLIYFGIILAIISAIGGFMAWYFITNEGLLNKLKVNKLKEMPYTMQNPDSLNVIFAMIPAISIAFIIIIIISSIFTYMSYDLFLKGYMNEPWDMKISFDNAKSKIGKIIGLSFLTFGVLILGFLLCCIGMIPATVFIALPFPAIIYENLGAGDALKRSYSLTKVNFWNLLGAIIVMQLIVSFASSFIQLLSIPFAILTPTSTILSTNMMSILPITLFSVFFIIVIIVFSFITSAFTISFYVVIYFNQRVKLENFGAEKIVEVIDNNQNQNIQNDDDDDE